MRKLRQLAPNARYHIIARVNHKELLLETAAAKTMFAVVLQQAKSRFSFRIENFAVMGSHVHLIVQPGPQENLSKIMKWIFQVFAQRYNKVYGTVGHFWAGRFASWILGNLSTFVRTFRYIDANPVAAGLVNVAWSWPWGGLWHHRHSIRAVVDDLLDWQRPLFPEHGALLLPKPVG